MKDLLGMRRAFVIRYSEHLWKAYTVIKFLYKFSYTKYTKQYILPYTHSHGVAPVLLNVHWLEHNNVSAFTALHEMQTRSSVKNNPSVCPSVKRVICDKMKQRLVQIFIPYERSFSLVFWEEEWLVGAIPSTWNFGSTGPRWSEIADFEPIFVRSASAVTRSKNVQLTLIESPLRAFQWA